MTFKIKPLFEVSLITLLLISNCTKANSGDKSKLALFGYTLSGGSKTTGSSSNQTENQPVTLTPPARATSTQGSTKVSLDVPAESGGVLKIGDELMFTIPAGSLSEDTTITIEKVESMGDNTSAGFKGLKQSYKFSPPGTTFALDKPAILELPIDSTELSKNNLHAKNQQVFFLDERQNYYYSVATYVDTNSKKLFASIEHFTSYTVMAASPTPGAASVTISAAGTVPLNVYADAPIYFRTLVTPNAAILGSSVMAVKLKYKKSTDPTFIEVAMKPEDSNTAHRYVFTVPSTFFTKADMLASSTIQYQIEAWDNFGKKTSLTPPALAVNRNCAPNSLRTSLLPIGGIFNIASGFQTNVTLQCMNEVSMTYVLPAANESLVYETASISDVPVRDQNNTNSFTNKPIGKLSSPISTGATFTAIQSYPVAGTVTFGLISSVPNSVVQQFDIKSGAIAIYELLRYDTSTNSFYGSVLDQFDVRNGLLNISTPTNMEEGQIAHFAVRGYDQYMNPIATNSSFNNTTYVNWSVPSNNSIGILNWNNVDPWVQFHSLDGVENTAGFITASIGEGLHNINHQINIIPRDWNIYDYGNTPNWKTKVKQVVKNGVTHSIYVAFSDTQPGLREQQLYYQLGTSAPVLIASQTADGPTMDANGCHIFCGFDIVVNNSDVYILTSVFNGSNYIGRLYKNGVIIHNNLNVGLNSSIYSMGATSDSTGIYIIQSERQIISSVVTKNTYVRKYSFASGLFPALMGGPLDVNPNNTFSRVTATMIGGIPYVSIPENDGTVGNLYVKKWNPGTASWVLVGTSAYTLGLNEVFGHSDLKAYGNNLYLAFAVTDNVTYTTSSIYVKKLVSSSWVDLALGSLKPSTNYSQDLNMDFDTVGTPYVFWTEYDAVSNLIAFETAHFNPLISGGSWQRNKRTLSGVLSFSGNISPLAFMVMNSNVPQLIYVHPGTLNNIQQVKLGYGTIY